MQNHEALLKLPIFKLLVDENITEFNKQHALADKPLDFSGAMLRGLDLRNMIADQISFENAYFRGADLRGIDFSNTNLKGASIAGAKISGAFFPSELTPEEIKLSFEQGTRMRYKHTT